MILKFANAANKNPKDLVNIIDYVRDENKTRPELIGANFCSVRQPYIDMKVTKQLHNKSSGKQYEHYIVSFDPEDDIEPERALKVLKDIAIRHNKHQSFYAVHIDTEHIHGHIVLNSVACDGQRFHQWKPQLEAFKSFISEAVCRKYAILPVRAAKGRKIIDDLNDLEFKNDEYKKYYTGGIIMSNYNNSGNCYEEDNYYIYDDTMEDYNEYNDDLIYSAYNSNVRIGNDINITAQSKTDCLEILGAVYKTTPQYSPDKLVTAFRYGNVRIGENVTITVTGDTEQIQLDDDTFIEADYYEPQSQLPDYWLK